MFWVCIVLSAFAVSTLIEGCVQKCPIVSRSSSRIDVHKNSPDCFTKALNVGEFCVFMCDQSINVSVPIAHCLPTGKWSVDLKKNAPSCIDREQPRLLTCPTNIVKKTDQNSMKVFWKEPTFVDNCGSNCLKISASRYSGGQFSVAGSPYTVQYKASDPSGNSNEECSFQIVIKRIGCPTLNAPLNGAVVQYNSGKIAQMSCRSGFYPDRTIAYLYVCINNRWIDPSGSSKMPLPDCLQRSPPNAAVVAVTTMLAFYGDCNTEAVKAQIIQNFVNFGGNLNGIFRCGGTV